MIAIWPLWPTWTLSSCTYPKFGCVTFCSSRLLTSRLIWFTIMAERWTMISTSGTTLWSRSWEPLIQRTWIPFWSRQRTCRRLSNQPSGESFKWFRRSITRRKSFWLHSQRSNCSALLNKLYVRVATKSRTLITWAMDYFLKWSIDPLQKREISTSTMECFAILSNLAKTWESLARKRTIACCRLCFSAVSHSSPTFMTTFHSLRWFANR